MNSLTYPPRANDAASSLSRGPANSTVSVAPQANGSQNSEATPHVIRENGQFIHDEEAPGTDEYHAPSPEQSEMLHIGNDIIDEIKIMLRYGSQNQKGRHVESIPRMDFSRDLHIYIRDYIDTDVRSLIAAQDHQKVKESLDCHILNYTSMVPLVFEGQVISQRTARILLPPEIHQLLDKYLAGQQIKPHDEEIYTTKYAKECLQKFLDVARKKWLNKKITLAVLAAQVVEAGNCGEMTALAYRLARQRFSDEYLVEIVRMSVDHMYCRVGKKAWPYEEWVVIDPWPKHAYAVLGKHHFSHGRETEDVSRQKKGKRGAPPNAKQDKYPAFAQEVQQALQAFMQTWSSTQQSQPEREHLLNNCLYPTPWTTRIKYDSASRAGDSRPARGGNRRRKAV